MDEEKKREEQDEEGKDSTAVRAEDYLESLLADAFKGKGYQKISELLQEKEIEPPQKYSESLFNQLDKALRKELDRHDFQSVSLLLRCIQVYLKSDTEETSLLIEQGLSQKISVIVLYRTRELAMLADTSENSFLMSLLEDFFDSALVICKCSDKGKKELVNLFLPELGHLVTEANTCWALQHEAMRTLNSILNGIPREERKKFHTSKEMCSLAKDLAKVLLEAGDYDLQVALSEALCRLMTKKWRDDLVHQWFEDSYLAEAFKEIKDREFETDCRKFLNQLNERLMKERRVYSFPCISAFADMNEVKKPSDDKLEEFWIDFNAGSQSVTFYVDSEEGALWETVRLQKEAVSSYSLKEDDGEQIVKIYMKIPAIFNKIEATKIKIFFSAQFEILSILKKVLGAEKNMVSVSEEESVHTGKQDRQNEAGIPESTNSQGRKDTSNSEGVGSLSGSLASQRSQQLMGTVPETVGSSVTVSTVVQETDVEDTPQGSAKKSQTPSLRKKTKPSEKPLEEESEEEPIPKKDVTQEKRNRRSSLAKQRTEGRDEIYDFENSDSASHEQVAEAKRKIPGQKTSSGQRNYEMGNKNEESSKQGRLSGYRKHLFSESDNGNTSSGQSEKSWILESQKRPLTKSVDYTRKKMRVRSKLKVLPVSSASSGGDYETEKGASKQRDQKWMPTEKSTSSSKGENLPTVDLTDGVLSEELEENPLWLSASPRGHSTDKKSVQNSHDAAGKLSREKGSFKQEDSDVLSGPIIKKPKFSSLEASYLSSDTSYKPKKLFDSVEKKDIQTGQEMDDNEDDVFFSKMVNEDFDGSGLIAAFEHFTGQLKKLFWSQYKRRKISALNTLRAAEKNFFTLLHQIHECRLRKLETLQNAVVEELASLEKETHILAAMEKDVVDSWNGQLLKMNSLWNQQKQRIWSDSALGETAMSFANASQNTTHESPVKKAAEKDVVIVPSD